jgi:hypothetical protein
MDKPTIKLGWKYASYEVGSEGSYVSQAGDYTLTQASELLRISKRSLGDWCRIGKWKGIAYKVEGERNQQWWIPRDAVTTEFEKLRGDTVDAEKETSKEPPTTVATVPQEVVTALQLIAAARDEDRVELKRLREEVASLREALAVRHADEQARRQEQAERDQQIAEAIRQARFRWPWQKWHTLPPYHA